MHIPSHCFCAVKQLTNYKDILVVKKWGGGLKIFKRFFRRQLNTIKAFD